MSDEKYYKGFIENLSLFNSSLEQDSELSFKDYKIDYNKCLGTGVFGSVFKIVPRPENEKGFISSWFPYIYDYIYRVNGNLKIEASQKYCIKLYKPAIQILFENIENELPLRRPIICFFEPSTEIKTNQILRRHGISGIKFFNSGMYHQFKTRVKGKTFKFYRDNNYFTDPNRFILRKSFIDFLRSLSKANLTFWEIHANNLMYDEYRYHWEIIDGNVAEVKTDKLININYESISILLSHLTLFQSKKIKTIFNAFLEFVKTNEEYTEDKDKALLAEVLPTITSLQFSLK